MPKPVSIKVEQNLAATMRDGTVLYADVYRPEASERYPVLLCRTPYNKEYWGRQGEIDPIRAAREGYAVVFQDVRGRYASGGEFYTFQNEIQDGYDTVEWVATQPWSIGKVGMFGGSYVGATQWLAAVGRPPHLAAIFPAVTSSDYYEGWTYQGGAFQLFFTLNWTLNMLTVGNLENLSRIHGDLSSKGERLIEELNHLDESLRFLPLNEYPHFKSPELATYYYDWLGHPSDDEYWQQWNLEERHKDIAVPSYNLGGWYDVFLRGTIRNFLGMKENGATEEAQQGQKLIIGPWNHEAVWNSATRIGDTDFGVMSGVASIDLDGIKLRWFDYWLKGIQNGINEEPPVRIFVMGVNTWRDENEWPLARTRYVDYYFHSSGSANTSNGDGTLDTVPSGDEAPDVFLYNPNDPVPSRGGSLCCYEASFPPGCFDQRDIETRSDVLVYTTAPLDKDMEVTGPVKVTLWAASSATDTDFTAKLVDVSTCGCANNLTDGIIRARYRESTVQPQLIEPGQPYEYTIDLWSTSNVFKTGHRIRIEVSSSNFPRFDRNPNTGNAFGADAVLKPAMQTILHDSEHPSHVTLPVIAG